MGNIVQLDATAAAGAEEVVRLRLLNAFSPERIVRYYKTLLEARKAPAETKKTGGGKCLPDFAVRLAALKDYMDRTHGRSPLRETEPPQLPPLTLEGLVAEAQKYPELRDGLLELLRAVEKC